MTVACPKVFSHKRLVREVLLVLLFLSVSSSRTFTGS